MQRRQVLLALALAPLLGSSAQAATPARTAKRVVALGPGAMRLLVYLGATELLVGCEDAERQAFIGSTYRLVLPRRVLQLPSLGPGGPGRLPDLEQLLALAPDLAVSVTLDGQQVQALQRRAGIPVLSLNYGDTGILLEGSIADSLRRLGAAVGREGRAAELVTYLHASIAELGRLVRGAPVLPAYLGGISLSGTHGLTSTQAGHRPLVWAGVRNLADDSGRKGHFFLDREQLLAWDPPVLFVDGGGLSGVLAEYARERTFYQRLQAVRQGQVYLTLPFNAYNSNLENALANAWFMAKVLHPGPLARVDSRAKTAEIMRAFLGVDVSGELSRLGYGQGRLDLATGRWVPLA